jgi:hypothetical protein
MYVKGPIVGAKSGKDIAIMTISRGNDANESCRNLLVIKLDPTTYVSDQLKFNNIHLQSI